MSQFKNREDARVEKQNGEVIGPYKTLFAGNTIIIDDPKADVEEGDIILRQLPNGKDERSLVTDAKFLNQRAAGFGPHYQIKFRKGAASEYQKPTQNIHIAGAQSVQIGDYNTQNIINSFETLKQKIESSSATDEEKAEAKSLLSKFLSHPLVTSILGGVAGSLGS